LIKDDAFNHTKHNSTKINYYKTIQTTIKLLHAWSPFQQPERPMDSAPTAFLKSDGGGSTTLTTWEMEKKINQVFAQSLSSCLANSTFCQVSNLTPFFQSISNVSSGEVCIQPQIWAQGETTLVWALTRAYSGV